MPLSPSTSLATAAQKPFHKQIVPNLDFDQVAAFLDSKVLPVAHLLDTEREALFEKFVEAGEQGLLTPKTPKALGGAEVSSAGYRQLQSQIAMRSGALAFLLTQHQSAASFLLAGENQALKEHYLPKMASGKKRVGVGFSHLRRVRSPLMATRVSGGYRLSGVVPWVTGAGLFEEFVVGATIEETGESVFGMLPLASVEANCKTSCETNTERTENKISGGIIMDAPMDLSGMRSTSTVRLKLSNCFLPDGDVISLRPAGWLASRDRANPLSPIGLIYGCASAACTLFSDSLSKRQIVHPIETQLKDQVAALGHVMEAKIALPLAAYKEKVAFRGAAIALMNTCAQTASIAAAGAANALNHPARRLQGEALVFSVSGQSTDGAMATLESMMPATTIEAL